MSRFVLAVVIYGWINGAGAAAPTYHIQLTAAQEELESTDDSFMAITGSIRSIVGLTRHSAINLNADLYSRAYNDLDQNDRNGMLLEAVFNYVPTGGFRKPTYVIGLRQELERFDQSARDADKTSLFLAVALRTSDRMTLTPGLEFYRRSSDVTESDVAGIFLNADMRMSSDWLGYLNIKMQSEDISVDAAASSALRASRMDIASGHLPGEPGYVPPATTASSATLESDSDNLIITLGANYSIDRHQSIDVSFENAEYDTSENGRINSKVLSLDYFYKF
jgi:hypothetical protein